MRTFTLLEEGQSARSIYVRGDGEVTVYDVGRTLRCRVSIDGAETAWQMLERVMPGTVHAEAVRLKIGRLVERVQTGWRPSYPDEIDPDIPQRTLRRARFAIETMAYPEDPEDPYHAPATVLMGVDESGRVQPTGEVLWIDAGREWALCEDGFWWTPAEAER
ncbi:hypothetical protein V1294_006055 [Bradyrhizobium sp. AZCC 1678]|uniref:hypothetical protein n=1 Tax=Bradyrhizobium sp. AZCC 1678 TaxID=3117030 RepID=UPI002FF32208